MDFTDLESSAVVLDEVENNVVEETLVVGNTPKKAPTKKPAAKKPRKKITVTEDSEIIAVDDAVDSSTPVEPRLPIGRIKNLMKLDTDGKGMLSADAVYLMTKATELFLQNVGRKSWSFAEHSHRKTISAQDFRLAIESDENLRFLEDML